jgi:hypothetical protein
MEKKHEVHKVTKKIVNGDFSMNERVFIKHRPKPDTFHKHSALDHILPKRTPIEESTGWIVLQKDGTKRLAKPQEVPKKLTCGVGPEDGVGEIDETLANMLPDENKTKMSRKRGEKK